MIQSGYSGLVVPSNDQDALQGALNELIENPDWAQALGSRGYEKLTKNFSMNTMAAHYQELFNASID